MNIPYFSPTPIRKMRSEKEMLRKSNEAELIKDGAWRHYTFDKSRKKKIAALRTIVRCHYIKSFCARMNISKVGLSYKEFKEYYFRTNPTRFQKEEINGI